MLRMFFQDKWNHSRYPEWNASPDDLLLLALIFPCLKVFDECYKTCKNVWMDIWGIMKWNSTNHRNVSCGQVCVKAELRSIKAMTNGVPLWSWYSFRSKTKKKIMINSTYSEDQASNMTPIHLLENKLENKLIMLNRTQPIYIYIRV